MTVISTSMAPAAAPAGAGQATQSDPASASGPAASIRVVVADDSPFICRLLTAYLHSSPDVEVVGMAFDGARAVELVRQVRPQALTLDLDMPGVDGLEALEQIMHECPTPVIIVSGISRQAAAITLQALELGAVDFILKYTPGEDTDPEVLRQEIIAKVRSAARIKVIRSIRTGRARPGPAAARPRPGARIPGRVSDSSTGTGKPAQAGAATRPDQIAPYLPGGVIVIGASTGGPVALRELLGGLPPDFAASIVVVQHIPAAFTEVLAAQLNRQIPLPVKEAAPGDRLEPGRVLIAPGDFHLLLGPTARVQLSRGPEINGHRPSIDVTMQSIAQVYGSQTTGIILTGMGSDGSLGLAGVRAKGGQTLAQNAATCVVNGMPQRAIERGVVDRVGSPADIARFLETAAGARKLRG